ncbi:DUF1840 family protein [Granulosicoccus sp. 3-233]|uniref:DUF1840 family protein n=1 Tax=Granulosicoccus sp. 3-233 TaxID=3417969 RepID=UPI003D33D074
MFGTAAVSLLKLMGQSGNVPGAILAADVPQALKTLHEGLAKLEAEELNPGSADAEENSQGGFDDEEQEAPVALHTRAGPLISLLEAAAAADESVLWDN